MKYIMLEHTTPEGMVQRIPIIFPNELIHKHVAAYIGNMLLRFHQIEATPVSAGEIDLGMIHHCGGESETLKLKSKGAEDALLINLYPYMHGMLDEDAAPAEFKNGTRVKITGGKYSGDMGFVSKVPANQKTQAFVIKIPAQNHIEVQLLRKHFIRLED